MLSKEKLQELQKKNAIAKEYYYYNNAQSKYYIVGVEHLKDDTKWTEAIATEEKYCFEEGTFLHAVEHNFFRAVEDLEDFEEEELEALGINTNLDVQKFFCYSTIVECCGLYFINEDNVEGHGSFVKCEYCGEWIDTEHNSDYIYNERDNTYYCDNECLENDGYIVCDRCNEVCREEYTYYIEDTGETLCNDCYADSDCFCCDDCGYNFSDNARCYCEEDDSDYCSNCYAERMEELTEESSTIKSYHTTKSKNAWTFNYLEGQKSYTVDYIAGELEVEAKGSYTPQTIADNVHQILNNNRQLAHFEHDGSLNNGVEIIFDPMTIEYLESNKDLFKQALKKIAELGGRSHDTKTCGLHIHYSNKNFNTYQKQLLVYTYQKFKDELVEFSRRTEDQLHWTKFFSFEAETKEDSTDISDISLNTYDRYHVVNLTNTDTIEIRLMRGTLNPTTFFACFELVNLIMDIVKEAKGDKKEIITNFLINCNFDELINYNNGLQNEHLKKYMRTKGGADTICA